AAGRGRECRVHGRKCTVFRYSSRENVGKGRKRPLMTARMTPRQCDLVLTAAQKFVVVAPIFLFVLFPVIAYFVLAMSDVLGLQPMRPELAWIPLGFLAVMAHVVVWSLCSRPFGLAVTHDQRSEFKSVRDGRRVRAANVLSIRPRSRRVQANMSGYDLV